MNPPAGAGTLVLVVGPSGAGKDTLIAIARDLLAGDSRIAFPRRIVTRQSSAAEDHDTLAPGEFVAAVRRGALAFWWEAHGLNYGIPARVNDELRDGKTVVCNVSRTVVAHLRRRYPACRVVLVDAPRAVREARIRARSRNADGDTLRRLDRSVESVAPLAPDLVIDNTGDPQAGGRALAEILLAAAGARQDLPPGARGTIAVRALATE